MKKIGVLIMAIGISVALFGGFILVMPNVFSQYAQTANVDVGVNEVSPGETIHPRYTIYTNELTDVTVQGKLDGETVYQYVINEDEWNSSRWTISYSDSFETSAPDNEGTYGLEIIGSYPDGSTVNDVDSFDVVKGPVTKYHVATATDPEGVGYVEVTPQHSDRMYEEGDNLTLEAMLQDMYSDSYSFDHWHFETRSDTESNPVDITVDSSVDATAYFQDENPNPKINARFSYSPLNQRVFKEVSFDASESTSDYEIGGYIWSFGDGEEARGKQVSHTYSQVGEYSVTLKVVDTQANEDTVTKAINISKPSDPVPQFSWSPQPPSVGEEVTFDAGDSKPIEPQEVLIDEYEWEFPDGTTKTGKTVAHKFKEVGASQEVTLTITTNVGTRKSLTKTVEVVNKQSIVPRMWAIVLTIVGVIVAIGGAVYAFRGE